MNILHNYTSWPHPSRDVYAWIMKNHEHQVPLHGDGRAGYGSASQSLVLSLSKGDRVWLQLRKVGVCSSYRGRIVVKV